MFISFTQKTSLHHQMGENSAENSSGHGSHLPERTELPEQCQWRLHDIYQQEEQWRADYHKLKSELIPAIMGFKDRLSTSAQVLANCLQLRDEIGIVSGRLYAFARMHRDENTAAAKYQAMTDQMEALLAEAGAASAFIEPEIIALADETLTAFRRQEQRLQEYSFYFDNLTREKKHVLSPAEEEILSRADEVTQAAENIFNMLAHADLKFPETIDEQGKTVQLSEGRYSVFIHSTDRNVRQQAFTNLFTTYQQYRNTFAATLSGSVKKNIFFAKTRKYPSALAASLEADNVPVQVYENLIATVHDNLQPLHDYVALKKKALRLDSIHMYDLYAPLVGEIKLEFSYEQATELVKTALSPLGRDYIDQLTAGLSSGWVDVYENKGKQTGAYAWGTYGIHPFVLLNYQDRYDDVSTLAHEMGHALHSYYSQNTQPYSTSGYTTFCAEVASTTNEILLLEHVLSHTPDKKNRAYLINQQLEQVRATVYRQTMFAEFEMLIHKNSEAGEALTAEALDRLWLDLNRQYYGEDIVIDPEIAVEWARIPHFYFDFYVYQYVTGYSAATALAEKILQNGAQAQQNYLTFLNSGGSDYSLEILKRAGVDMTTPKPIEITLKKFSALLQTLEKDLQTLDN